MISVLRSFSLVVFACLTLNSLVYAQTQDAKHQLIPLENLAALPSKSLMTLSEDGSRIAYREKTEKFDGIVVVDSQSFELVRAAAIGEIQATRLQFVTNDIVLLHVEEQRKILGYIGRHEMSAVFVLNVKTNKIFQLMTAGYGIKLGQTRLGRIKGFTADRKAAYMMAYDDKNRHNMYRVNIEKKQRPRLVKRGTADTIDMFIKDGEVIARERYNQDTNIHQVESKVDGNWIDIHREETPFITKSFSGFTPDKSSLVMVAQNKDTGRWAYYLVALADGKISGPMFSHKDKDVESRVYGKDDVIIGVKYSGFKPSYEFFNNKLNARFRGLAAAMPNNTFYLQSWTDDKNTMLMLMEGEMSSGQYIRYSNGALEHVAFVRPSVAPELVSHATPYEFKARDGLTIPSLLSLPIHKEPKQLPAIVMPHGGPESYDKVTYDWLVQYFTNRGYAVIQPQFRGSTGFGSDFLYAGRGEWGRKMQDDITDSVQHLAAQKTINPERVCILGWSYGGYAAMAGITLTPELYQCGVAINGVSNIPMMLDREQKEHGRRSSVVEYWNEAIVNGKRTMAELKASSPARNANSAKAPMLLVHGTHDKVVHISQSEEMYDALDDLDRPVKMVKISKGDHNLYTAEHRLKLLKEVDAFIRQHLPVRD